MAPPAIQVVDATVAPLDAVSAPITAPVTPVIEQVAGPVAGLATGTLPPVTSVVGAVTAPVVDFIPDAAAVVQPAVVPTLGGTATISEAPEAEPVPTPSAADGAVDAFATTSSVAESVLPVGVVVDGQNVAVSPPRPSGLPGTAAVGNPVQMNSSGPAPGLPFKPGPESPATAPAGSGSTLRAGSDAGSAFADFAASQFPFPRSSLAEVLRRSEELPGSVSFDHGFSPD